MPERQMINPDWPWTEKFRFSQGLKVGDTIYVSGQIALDPAGNVVGEDDMLAQSRQTFANIRTVLDLAGATMRDVVKTTTFVTDISRYAAFAKAREEAFPDTIPASTLVETSALVKPALLVEVEAVAVIDRP